MCCRAHLHSEAQGSILQCTQGYVLIGVAQRRHIVWLLMSYDMQDILARSSGRHDPAMALEPPLRTDITTTAPLIEWCEKDIRHRHPGPASGLLATSY